MNIKNGKKKKKGRTSKRIIKNTLTSHMKQRSRKIRKSHLHRIIQTPQSCSKRIRNPHKPTTRSGVGFEHEQFFSVGLGKVGGVEVGCDDGLTGCVIEVGWEYLLGIDECADTELSETVVGGIAIIRFK